MSIPILATVVLWDSDSSNVVAIHKNDWGRQQRAHGRPYAGNVSPGERNMPNPTRDQMLQHLLETLVFIVDDDGVDEAAARSAFLDIDEWREVYGDVAKLDVALRIRRAEVEMYGHDHTHLRGDPVLS